MNINKKYDLMKKILTKDLVKKHLFALHEAGMFGKLPMKTQLIGAIGLYLPNAIFHDLIYSKAEEMDEIGKSCKTLCHRVSLPLVKEIMSDCHYIWPENAVV